MTDELTGYSMLKVKFSTEEELNVRALSYDGVAVNFKEFFVLIDNKMKELMLTYKNGDTIEIPDTQSIESVVTIFAANEMGLHIEIKPIKTTIKK